MISPPQADRFQSMIPTRRHADLLARDLDRHRRDDDILLFAEADNITVNVLCYIAQVFYDPFNVTLSIFKRPISTMTMLPL